MRATRQLAALYAALVMAASFVWTAGAESQASNTQKEHFVATAVDMGNSGGRAVASQIDIVINLWTSDAARDRLVSVLREKAAEGLLKALQKEPTVGRISAPGTLAYDLHYARQMPGEDGGRRIVLGTDRPVGFWEAQSGARTLDYPFTLIELRVDNDGKGEGKLSMATRPTLNDNVLVLEDYAAQPVLLQNVHRFR